MKPAWTTERADAIRAASKLVEQLSDPESELIDLGKTYVSAKRTLANCFEEIAHSAYGESSAMANVIAELERELRRRYPNADAKHVKVKGYGAAHRRLVGMLFQRVGEPVTVEELRMLTGDAVHTERRTRELRDLGLDISARHESGRDVYVLTSTELDLEYAVPRLMRRSIQADRGMSKSEQAALMAALDLD